MPSNTHLDKARREQQRLAAPDANQVARKGCFKRGLTPEQTNDYMIVFRQVRGLTVNGVDTEPMLRQFEAMPDGDLAVAAYLEAVASTRPAGWAQ